VSPPLRRRTPQDQDPQTRLREQLATLRARYDTGAVPPAVFAVMRELERDLAWHEHKAA